jgi:hypothetical protein
MASCRLIKAQDVEAKRMFLKIDKDQAPPRICSEDFFFKNFASSGGGIDRAEDHLYISFPDSAAPRE